MASVKKSPIKLTPLPHAGSSVQREFDRLFHERVTFWILAGVLFIAAALREWARYVWDTPPSPWTMTIIAGAACLIITLYILRSIRKLRWLHLGLTGEQAVADRLDELKGQGYQVIHDIPGDGFNVDHVVVGPTGVFVVETKTRTKAEGPDARVDYDGNTVRVAGIMPDRDPVKQARALSDFIGHLIKTKLGLDIPIRPVVVFPGWWVNEPRPAPEVWVLNDLRLLGYIVNASGTLTEERILTVSTVLKDHVRTQQALQ